MSPLWLLSSLNICLDDKVNELEYSAWSPNIGVIITVLVAIEHLTISDADPMQLMSETSHLRTRRSRSDFSDLSPDYIPQAGQVIAGLNTVMQLYAEAYGMSGVTSLRPACINHEHSYRNPVALKKRLVREYCYVRQSSAIVVALTFTQSLDSKYRLESALQSLIGTVAASYGVGSRISCGDNPVSLERSNPTVYFNVLLDLKSLLRCSIPAIRI